MAREALLGRLRLPLESPPEEGEEPPDREGAVFSSAPFFIPAGTYRLRGELSPDALLCNGQGCFAKAESSAPFETRVGLRWFQLRAPLAREVELEPLTVGPTRYVAERSQEIAPGLRLHFLDENTFFEPTGFWVRGRSTARLVIEAEAAARLAFSIRNGGEHNWVEVERAEQPGELWRFALRAWEEKRVETAAAAGLERLSIGCTAVFRAAPRGDAAADRRPLGVFVTASRL